MSELNFSKMLWVLVGISFVVVSTLKKGLREVKIDVNPKKADISAKLRATTIAPRTKLIVNTKDLKIGSRETLNLCMAELGRIWHHA